MGSRKFHCFSIGRTAPLIYTLDIMGLILTIFVSWDAGSVDRDFNCMGIDTNQGRSGFHGYCHIEGFS